MLAGGLTLGDDSAAHGAPPPPSVLTVGTRLTWLAGDATLEGVKLVPDADGWLWRDNQWWRPESTGGSGGAGYTQLDIVSSSTTEVVADVRTLLTIDLQRNINISGGAAVVVGNADALGDFWIAPAQLAALQEGVQGQTRIWKGQRQVGNRTFDVVSSATTSSGTYVSYTYDLATGLLLVSGTMNAGEGVFVTDESGNLIDQASGAVSMTHRQFVGTRPITVPWAASPPPAWATVGRTNVYEGVTRGELNDNGGLPPDPGRRMVVQHTFDRAVGTALIGRQISSIETGIAGITPIPTQAERVYSSAIFDGMWIAPAALAGIAPQTVLDQDPITGQTVVFGGSQGTTALIVTQTPAELLELYYDTQSGRLVQTRYRQDMAGVGASVIELAWVREE